MVIDAAVIDTWAPATIDVVERFMSAPLVPTVPSNTCDPPEDSIRNHEAVPVASADESAVIAFRVSTPPDAAAANVA